MNATASQVLDVIKKSDITSTDAAKLAAHLPLRLQGVDSLEMATIFFNIEDVFKVTIPHTDYERLKSVDQIVEYLNQQG